MGMQNTANPTLHVDRQGVVRFGDYGQTLGYVNRSSRFGWEALLQGVRVATGTRRADVVAAVVDGFTADLHNGCTLRIRAAA